MISHQQVYNHICKSILDLNTEEIKILADHQIRSIPTMGSIIREWITTWKPAITPILIEYILEVTIYIVQQIPD